jgi:hypothetical protein
LETVKPVVKSEAVIKVEKEDSKSNLNESLDVDVTNIEAENEVVVKTETTESEGVSTSQPNAGPVKQEMKMEVEEEHIEVCNEVEIGTTEEVEVKEEKVEPQSTESAAEPKKVDSVPVTPSNQR